MGGTFDLTPGIALNNVGLEYVSTVVYLIVRLCLPLTTVLSVQIHGMTHATITIGNSGIGMTNVTITMTNAAITIGTLWHWHDQERAHQQFVQQCQVWHQGTHGGHGRRE